MKSQTPQVGENIELFKIATNIVFGNFNISQVTLQQ